MKTNGHNKHLPDDLNLLDTEQGQRLIKQCGVDPRVTHARKTVLAHMGIWCGLGASALAGGLFAATFPGLLSLLVLLCVIAGIGGGYWLLTRHH